MDVRSFTSRRPAAGSLPAFTLPSPLSDIPRVVESISPSLSGVNTASSAASHPSPSMSHYNSNPAPNFGHTHGNWQTPGPAAYQLNSGTSPQQTTAQQHAPGLGLSSLAPPRQQMYGFGSSSVSYARDAVSPTEGLPPPNESLSQSFPAPLSSNGVHSQYGSSLGHHSLHSNGNSSSLNGYSGSQKSGAASYQLPSPIVHTPAPYQAYSASMPSPSQASPTAGSYAQGAQMPQKPSFSGFNAVTNGPGTMMSNMHHSVLGGQHMGIPGYHGSSHLMWPQHAAHTSPAQDRPFRCHVCPQAFTRNHDLKRHKRIHLSVKPFPCDGCSKSFSRKDALKRHKLVKGCEQDKKRKRGDSDTNDLEENEEVHIMDGMDDQSQEA